MAKDDVVKNPSKSIKDADKKKVEEKKPKTEVKKKTPAKTKPKKQETKKSVKKTETKPKTKKKKQTAKKQTTTKKKTTPKKKTTARSKEIKPKEEKKPVKTEKGIKTEEEVAEEEKEEKYKAKKKPKLTKEQKEKLRIRKQIKKRTPDFLREEWFRYKRLTKSWRRPDGISSKMRINLKYRPSKVRVGFRGPRETRGLHSSGFEEIIVYNVKDIEKLDPKIQAARIGSTVGTKKRIEIEKKAEELDIRILNM